MPILGILASQGRVAANSYESIATVTVGAGGSATVTFSSIPATYKHLQIRGIARATAAGQTYDYLRARFNSDSGSNYARHILLGNGSTASASGAATQNLMNLGEAPGATGTASVFSGSVIDILDYANTSKYKTLRVLNGNDQNSTAGTIYFASSLWQNTAAITSVTIFADISNIAQYSSFALYGIKG